MSNLAQSLYFSKLLLYADNAKVLWSIRSPLNCTKLQHNLDSFFEWPTQWPALEYRQMRQMLNYIFFAVPSKVLFDYYIQGRLLSRVSSVRDLGVIFDDDLFFRSHIVTVYNKSVHTFGFIKRSTFDFRHTSTITYLYR